jgi:hypothetical protein
MVTGGINKAIKENARITTDWKYRAEADFAYSIYEAANEMLYNSMLPEVVIGFDNRIKKQGEYYFEGDNISLKHHFDIRDDLTKLETIIAVLHNTVHVNQDVYKAKGQWYHTQTFRDGIKQWGIEVDKAGDAVYLDIHVFNDTLDKIGQSAYRSDVLDFDSVEATNFSLNSNNPQPTITKVKAPGTKNKSTVKMKKWSCSCNPPINVRCAVNLLAYCTVCLSDFELQG